MKILVVDDDKEIVELLSIYLKNEGYEPIAAYSGKEAITKLTTTPDIALMILDVMMPNMSGIEVIKEVRKDSDIPIIIVSAKTGDMDKIQGLITGADDYSADEIFERVWQQESIVSAKTVMVHVSHLRDKIQKATGGEDVIQTVWGVGYKVEA